jgi:hypothetical protein
MNVAFYTILVTPLKTNETYGDQVDITDYVIARKFNKIKQSVDSGSYDIGIYTYADLSLTVANYDGRFNDETESSSMFYFTRDRAKIQVKYTNEAGTESVIYNGLINDEATLQDFEKDTVKFRILSQDSIFRKVKVIGGLINDGVTFSAAIKSVLNRPAITAILGYDAGKVSVGYDGIIDDSTPFSQKDSRTVLELLLNASGSVFYIDDAGDMVVSDRTVGSSGAAVYASLTDEAGAVLTDEAGATLQSLESVGGSNLELYGAGDPYQRDNIAKINNYNNGLQRTFNTITVNEQTSTDETFVDRYGIGLKSYTFDFITSTATATAIADYYLEQFKVPKAELKVYVKTDISTGVNILDPVTIDYRKRHKPFNGSKIPLAGSSVAGSEKSPYVIGGIKIAPNRIWKVIGIEYDTKTFLTALRLRES